MTNSTVYKIRRKTDGLFSMGGSMPRFNKTGKIWKQRGHLTNHLNQLWNGGGNRYNDCEIVVCELVETHTGSITLQEWLQEIEDRKNREILSSVLHKQKVQKEERRKQFLELQKEFG